MRILLACQQSEHTHPVPAYGFWRDYFLAGLREAGHEVDEIAGVDWARGLLPLSAEERASWLTDTWSRTVETVQSARGEKHYDLFLTYLYPNQVDVSAIRTIREHGVSCVNFFCDNVREFRYIPDGFRPFDLHWVPEVGALPLYAAARLPALSAPMPCWVDPSWRNLPEQESLPPTFVGTRDSVRERWWVEVFNLGVKVDLRGKGWIGERPQPIKLSGTSRLRSQWQFLDQHGPVAWARRLRDKILPPRPVTYNFTPRVRDIPQGDEYFWVLRESSVCVGLNRYPSFRHSRSRPGTYSRLRDLEAPMVGACYLTEWTEGLDQMYDLGSEIETYRTAEEFRDKLAALEADPERRKRMRQAAQKRALAELTVGQSIGRIARRLGFSA